MPRIQLTVLLFVPPGLLTVFPPEELMSVAVTVPTDCVPDMLSNALLVAVTASKVHPVAENNPDEL